MNLKVHETLSLACLTPKYKSEFPEIISIFSSLFDYYEYFDKYKDDEETKSFLSSLKEEQEGSQDDPRVKRTKSNSVDAFSIFEEGVEKELEIKEKGLEAESREEELEGEDKKEFKGNYEEAYRKYEDAYILGYKNALLGRARATTDYQEAFAYYRWAAVEHKVSQGYFEIAKMVRDGFKLPEEVLKFDERVKTPEFWFERAIVNQSPEPITKDFSPGAAFALAEIYEKQHKNDKAIAVYEILRRKGYIRGFLEHGRILENMGKYSDAKCIYANKELGWFGATAQRKLATTTQEKKIWVEKENKLFKTYFQSLIGKRD